MEEKGWLAGVSVVSCACEAQKTQTQKFHPFHLQLAGRQITAFSQFRVYRFSFVHHNSIARLRDWATKRRPWRLIRFSFYWNYCRLNQPPLSGNGSNALGGRHLHPTLSPDSDSDSDSDISLGTHSPIPSMTSQHSPNSSSGLNDRDLDRLAEEHRDPRGEKDYRNFASLQSFRFGEHINVAGFTSEFVGRRHWNALNSFSSSHRRIQPAISTRDALSNRRERVSDALAADRNHSVVDPDRSGGSHGAEPAGLQFTSWADSSATATAAKRSNGCDDRLRCQRAVEWKPADLVASSSESKSYSAFGSSVSVADPRQLAHAH